MSRDVYAADKVRAYPERLRALQAGRDIYPVHLHLILSDLCNLDCPGCAYRMADYSSAQRFIVRDDEGGIITRNPPRFLEPDLVQTVLDDCARMGTQGVEFTGGGEPTVHPQCRELLGYAQGLGLDTALITNGLLLDKIGEEAVRTKWLRVSIDAATSETFDVVRPTLGATGSTFDRVIERTRAAVSLRDQLGTDCVIGAGFVVQRENWREIADAAALYQSLGVDNMRISALFTSEFDGYFGEWREAAELLEREAVERFDRPGFRVYGRLGEKLDDLAAPPDYPRCGYQHFTTYLAGDGNLYRCCVTSYNDQGHLGSVRDAGGLQALLDDPATRSLLNDFDARSCGRCQFNDRNRTINALIDGPPVKGGPADLAHASFV